jgi:hypothetical protein
VLVDERDDVDEHGKAVAIAAGAFGTLAGGIWAVNKASAAVAATSNAFQVLGGALGRVKRGGEGSTAALGKVSGLVGAGGPWGLAIAGAVTVVGLFAAKHAAAKRRVDDLKSSLDKETGALTAVSKATVAKALQDQGAYDAARFLGVSIRDVTEAAIGNVAAQKRVNAAVAEASARYRALTPEQRTSNAWARELGRNIDTLQTSVSGQNAEVRKATGAFNRESAAAANVRQATESNTAATRRAKNATAELHKEVSRLPRSRDTKVNALTAQARRNIRETQGAIDRMHGKNVTVTATVKLPTQASWWVAYRAGERKATGGQIGDGVGTQDEVAGAGGHAAVKRIRRAAAAGQLRGYAAGGPITASTPGGIRRLFNRADDDLGAYARAWGRFIEARTEANLAKMIGSMSAMGGGSASGGWRRLWALVHGAFPGAHLASAFRPGAITATGNRSYHALGRAIDVTPSMAIFEWIRRNYGARTKELIYSPAGGRQIHNGQPHYYSGITRAMHWNHVHWAYDRGGYATGAGWIPKGPAPERVLSPRQTSAFENLVRTLDRGGAGGGVTVNVEFPNYYGDRGDLRREFNAWARSGDLGRALQLAGYRRS